MRTRLESERLVRKLCRQVVMEPLQIAMEMERKGQILEILGGGKKYLLD